MVTLIILPIFKENILELTWIHEYDLFPLISDYRHLSLRFLLFRSPLHTLLIRPRSQFMFTAFRYFIHPNRLHWTEIFLEALFEKKYDNHCTGKEYPPPKRKKKDEPKQIEIKAYRLQTSSIIVERAPVSYCYTSKIGFQNACLT